MNRIIATTADHSEYKHKQMFNTDFTGALIKCQQISHLKLVILQIKKYIQLLFRCYIFFTQTALN